MDLTMDIASLSVAMNTARTAQDLSIATMKLAMNSSTDAVTELLSDMTSAASVDPNLGNSIDVSV